MDKIKEENFTNLENDLEEGEIAKDNDDDDREKTFEEQDAFVLGDANNIQQQNNDIRTELVLFDRSTIVHRTGNNAELRTLDLANVDVYDAGRLENELIGQATKTIDAAENMGKRKFVGRTKIASLLQQTDDSVKKGDLTPFELMIKKQEELAKLRQKKPHTSVNKTNNGQLKQEILDFPSKRRWIERKVKRVNRKTSGQEDDESSYSSSNSSYSESEEDDEEDEEEEGCSEKPTSSKKLIRNSTARMTTRMTKDDGCEEHFEERIRHFKAQQELARISDEPFDDPSDYHQLTDEHRVSKFVWNKLYKYQKTGVRWLHELHSQCVGGILADEMGLGKTIQLCVFLRSLAESQRQSNIFKYKGLGPSLIVCPATVLHQWVQELGIWFPLCYVAVLHSSGAHTGSKGGLIKRMGDYRRDGSILVTTYSTYVLEYKKIVAVNWHYVLLDEGHKIRNPDAKVTQALKELRTPHRIIISGSPLQNNLKELWSLIDFIYPGRLGSLKEFISKFSIPITQGGYANATAIQVRTAYKCACVLRDAINAYLLRRMKKDVQMVLQLPEKTEQILFCDITSEQRDIYLEFIQSKTCQEALTGSQMPFAALMFLRKLCNHPDLATGGPNKYGDLNMHGQPELEFGACQRSGKMIVVRTLLRLWFEQGQKVLFFSQSRQMLTIIERFIILEGYKYLRMDGTTPIGIRQELVNRFNNDKDVFIFLLTTKVGGLGINLTGANRVLIYDPDWNPSTDAQARERAWRIGQRRAVTIYRLLTSGTIEEKIYQRQIFKHFLTNRVLVNPKQQRFFKTNDLHELFTLGSSKSDKKYGTETAAIFSATTSETLKGQKERKGKKRVKPTLPDLDESLEKVDEIEGKEEGEGEGGELSEETRQRLRKMARKLAGNYSQKSSLEAVNGAAEDSGRRKKRRVPVLFEGVYQVPMLKRQETIRRRSASEEEAESVPNSREQDDYVLNKLLKKSAGVHSALQHDQIVKNGSVADIQLIEDEANAVARRAAEVLKRSRRVQQAFLENVSQFGALAPKTSKNSIFGRKRAVEFVEMSQFDAKPSKKQRDDDQEEAEENREKWRQFDGSAFHRKGSGQASAGADLLQTIKRRRERQLDTDEREMLLEEGQEEEWDDEIRNYPSLAAQLPTEVARFGDRYERLAEDIRTFLAINNGQARTEAILGHFKEKVQAQDVFVFRSTLKRLCRLLPNSQWVLKDEFA